VVGALPCNKLPSKPLFAAADVVVTGTACTVVVGALPCSKFPRPPLVVTAFEVIDAVLDVVEERVVIPNALDVAALGPKLKFPKLSPCVTPAPPAIRCSISGIANPADDRLLLCTISAVCMILAPS